MTPHFLTFRSMVCLMSPGRLRLLLAPYSKLCTLYHRAVDLSECGQDYRVKTNNSNSHLKNESDIQSFISMLKGMKTWDDYTLQTAGQAPSLRSLMSLFQAQKSLASIYLNFWKVLEVSDGTLFQIWTETNSFVNFEKFVSFSRDERTCQFSHKDWAERACAQVWTLLKSGS